MPRKVHVIVVGMVPFQKPGKSEEYHVMAAKAGKAALADANIPLGLDVIRIGELEIRQIEDFWSIFQDLSDSLGVENNFAAHRKVRQAIRQRDPELFKRLEFDPDADFISIRAGSEADIRQAAEIIQSIL